METILPALMNPLILSTEAPKVTIHAKSFVVDDDITQIGSHNNLLPIFDIWPYHYTSNFAIREGFAPLLDTRHPDFYIH